MPSSNPVNNPAEYHLAPGAFLQTEATAQEEAEPQSSPGLSPTWPTTQQPTTHAIPSHPFHITARLFPAIHGQPLSAHPHPSQRCHRSPQRATRSLQGPGWYSISQASSSLLASIFVSSLAQTPFPKSETGSFCVDDQMATAFSMDYMGFATMIAFAGIESSRRSGQPKQQNLYRLHTRVDIWLSHSQHCSLDQCLHPCVSHSHKGPLTTCRYLMIEA